MLQKRKSQVVISLLIIGILITTGLVLGNIIISSLSDSCYPYFVCYGDICCEYEVYTNNEFTGSENITISIIGNNITFNQTKLSYCSPSITDPCHFGMDLSLVGNNLTLREVYELKGLPPSRCRYLFIINGTINNIPEGTYNLIFIFNREDQSYVLKVFEIII